MSIESLRSWVVTVVLSPFIVVTGSLSEVVRLRFERMVSSDGRASYWVFCYGLVIGLAWVGLRRTRSRLVGFLVWLAGGSTFCYGD